MPRKEVTPDTLIEMGRLIVEGKIDDIKIHQKRSGKNRGDLVIDYKLRAVIEGTTIEKLARQEAMTALASAAIALQQGILTKVSFKRTEEPEIERYVWGVVTN